MTKTTGLNTERTRTMLLCAFFGVFGAHKFYQGKTAQGITFIILDLTIVGILVTALWSFINLVMLTIDKKNNDKEFTLGIVLIILHGVSAYTSRASFIEGNLIFPKANKEAQEQTTKKQDVEKSSQKKIKHSKTATQTK